MRSRDDIAQERFGGALMALAPLPLLFSLAGVQDFHLSLTLLLCLVATIFCLGSALLLTLKPVLGKGCLLAALLCVYAAVFKTLHANPFAALLAMVLFIGAVFFLLDFQPIPRRKGRTEQEFGVRAWWALAVVSVPLVASLLPTGPPSRWALAVAACSCGIALILYLHYGVLTRKKAVVCVGSGGIIVLILLFVWSKDRFVPVYILLLCLVCLLSLPRHLEGFEKTEHWWEILLDHPARVMLTTFLLLCMLGSLLLLLPEATVHQGSMNTVDAVFTSVSAVCVTGLVVLDTPVDFTILGQVFILLLIQFGGLGIMSITTVALHAMGRRLSLRQERLMTSMTGGESFDLFKALKIILLFTFLVEGCGAVLLTVLFQLAGEPLGTALWQGIFTSISAFCNAGFALHSASLIPFQASYLILGTVSLLIIIGGIAPAACLAVPAWLTGKNTTLAVRLSLTTTLVLLLSGTLVMLAFEWNGIFGDLSIGKKIVNAWFQSVTLRTAGFNSVDLTTLASPTLILCLFFMFIGGSPGGTAGGIKTTTIGILALTFYANINSRSEVVIWNRRIASSTVYRAVTIMIAGSVVWFVILLMLLTTQQIPVRELVFEATSAIATVGLSLGATVKLDEIGKVVIIMGMFIGRIGPMTLFMLLHDGRENITSSGCSEETLSLT